MSGDDDDVIRSAKDHDIPVFIFHCKISDSIPVFDLVPVLLVPFFILIDGSHHGWPGFFYDKESSLSGWDRVSLLVNNICNNSRDWNSGKSWFHGFTQWCGYHVHTGFCLPPGIQDRALVSANDPVVPLKSFRIERFTD